MTSSANLPTRLIGSLKRAFDQFLALPLAVVTSFIVITVVVYWADAAWSKGQIPAGFNWLGAILGDSSSLATLLATIASSIITVTSITFSLLLIALQQGSSALTTQVTDQFLMRRSNQFYFGYFVGLSIFALLSLVTASSIHRPVFGASLIVILTIAALCMIVVLIYSTIDQMRPTQIVRAIHHHVLQARSKELAFLAMTRRRPRSKWPTIDQLRSVETGHIVAIDVERLMKEIGAIECGRVEIEFAVPIGRYMAFGDPLVTLRAESADHLEASVLDRVRQAIFGVVVFDDARNLRNDSSFGINQLATIAWTSGSTAKSNPAPALAVIQSLRDILSRWSTEGGYVDGSESSLVVIDDTAPNQAIACFESIVLVSSESMQAQTLAAVIQTLTVLLDVVPSAWRDALAEVARRSLSSLGEHVLTCELERDLNALSVALTAHGFAEIGASVREATEALAMTLGTLNSRSTRVPN